MNFDYSQCKQKGVAQIYLLIILLIVGIGGYYYFSKSSNKSVPQPTQSMTPTKIADETANWKTYSNSEHKISFKYPQIRSQMEQLVKIPYLSELKLRI